MRVLYAIQGTGNGHLSRAGDIVPALNKQCETDILVSGTQADVTIPFPVKYRFDGMSFIFGKGGGVDVWNTYVNANIRRFKDEIARLPVVDYDLIINDFEPVSAWAGMINRVPCISLSHQAALLKRGVPKPGGSTIFGRSILKYYAPSHAQVGFHFSSYSKNIYSPVIRREIRSLKPSNNGHITVYLPSYEDRRIIDVLSQVSDTEWDVFSKHNKSAAKYGNVRIRPISSRPFMQSLASARGVLCGAGFETPAETLYLGKQLLVVPMKTQYEQQCNAEALRCMGVPVIPKLKEKYLPQIRAWAASDYKVQVSYPDITDKIIGNILNNIYPEVRLLMATKNESSFSLKDLIFKAD